MKLNDPCIIVANLQFWMDAKDLFLRESCFLARLCLGGKPTIITLHPDVTKCALLISGRDEMRTANTSYQRIGTPPLNLPLVYGHGWPHCPICDDFNFCATLQWTSMRILLIEQRMLPVNPPISAACLPGHYPKSYSSANLPVKHAHQTSLACSN